MRSPMPALAILWAVLAAACAVPAKRVPIWPSGPAFGPEVTRLRYAASAASHFARPDGGACRPWAPPVRDALAGWAAESDRPACLMETADHSGPEGDLELTWRGRIPADGDYTVLPAGFGVGAWGTVVSRGSYYMDFVARAVLQVEAEAPSCRARWEHPLAAAMVTGPWVRTADFSGWVVVDPLALPGCRAGEELELRVRLHAEVLRGRVIVDGFGLAAATDEDLDRAFGLAPRPAVPAVAGAAARAAVASPPLRP